MRYKSFRIQNFKGIKDTTISFDTIAGASVFAFVGLNESGKTTILEAIHSFAPDKATSELLGSDDTSGVPFKHRVPRHLISTFSGDVSVEAVLTVTAEDRTRLTGAVRESTEFEINPQSIPDEIILERKQRFQNGDLKRNSFLLRTSLLVKSSKQRRWHEPSNDETLALRDIIYEYVPEIAYFPTFVFNFPSRIYLTDRGYDDPKNRFYQRVFQDILDHDGQGHTISKDIIGRVRDKGLVLPWPQFFLEWTKHDNPRKIQHVMDRASAAVTRLVFGRWNQIFGEKTKGKEIIISYNMDQGQRLSTQGTPIQTNEHDIYITFEIKDGTRRFPVNDRSLGFRWFFAFMLFTQFRVARDAGVPLLFLFDEPASNLHAAAQQKLIESFPEIAKGEHSLAYTTHSHYMIEPKWLEQTFIVTNRADAPQECPILDAVSLDDESLDIRGSSLSHFC